LYDRVQQAPGADAVGGFCLFLRQWPRGSGAALGHVTRMNHQLERLIGHHLILMILLAAGFFGLACCGIFLLADRMDAIVLSSIGALGTVLTASFLCFIGGRPRSWHFLGVGRAAWMVVLASAWLAGVASALFMLYGMSH
jgi:hypothetical protein